MVIECPECKQEMENIGTAIDLLKAIHYYVCFDCKIELMKQTQREDVYTH